MIGLDTNIIVRYLVQDDKGQSARTSKIIENLTDADPGFVSLVTIVELWWVLRRAYDVSSNDCADVIDGLLDARELRIGDETVVRAALVASRNGTDFADAVIAELGRSAGCGVTLTFDRKAAKSELMKLT